MACSSSPTSRQTRPMKITSVRVTPLNLPVTMGTGARAKSTSSSLCIVDVELDDAPELEVELELDDEAEETFSRSEREGQRS